MVRLKLMAGVALAAFLVAFGAAKANTYVFAYEFADGNTITGAFSGTPNNGLIDIGSVYWAQYDGTTLSGPLYAYSYTAAGSDCGSCWTNSGAVASTNPLDNNFAFINAKGDPTNLNSAVYSNYFYVIPWPNGTNNPVAVQYDNKGNYNQLYNGEFVPANFSVSAVPETSTWVMMLLGFGALGLVGRRRSSLTASGAV